MGQMIELTAADGHTLSAYAADGPADGEALVVAQEAFGVNRHIRQVCDRLANAGFRVVAPALFDRIERGVETDYSAASIAKYHALPPCIDEAAVLRDLAAAAHHLEVGVVGYCFGGTWRGGRRRAPRGAAEVQLHVYPGADHGFGCDQRASFHAPSYLLAQQSTVEFLCRHLS